MRLIGRHPTSASFPWHTSALVEVSDSPQPGRFPFKPCSADRAPRCRAPFVPLVSSSKSPHSGFSCLSTTAVDETPGDGTDGLPSRAPRWTSTHCRIRIGVRYASSLRLATSPARSQKSRPGGCLTSEALWRFIQLHRQSVTRRLSVGIAMTRVVSTILNTGADRLLSAANLNQQYSLTDPEAQILRCLKAGKERSTIAAELALTKSL